MVLNNISLSEIKDELGDNSLYLWGAGAILNYYFPMLGKYLNLGCVRAVVDIKQKGFRSIGGRDVPIISPDVFFKSVKNNDLLIITTKYYDDVNQFIKETYRDSIRICIYCDTVTEQYKRLDNERSKVYVPSTFKIADRQIIPKVIHYCWFGKSDIPEKCKNWMSSWKKYCPDYEVIEWNESNYDIHKNKYIEQAYEKKKWAFVSDYARLDVIYNFGGVYLDTDVEIMKSIDDLLYNEAFCGFEKKEYVNFGLGYGAKKNNSVIKEIMSVYEKKEFLKNDGTFDETTCPVIQSEIMELHGLKRDGSFQTVESFTVMPEIVLCPLSPYTMKLSNDLSKSYMIHHFAASWNSAAADYYTKLNPNR